MFKTLKYNLGDDGIAVVTIDVPDSKANVIGEAMRADIDADWSHRLKATRTCAAW